MGKVMINYRRGKDLSVRGKHYPVIHDNSFFLISLP
jgi:hypothetical protein